MCAIGSARHEGFVHCSMHSLIDEAIFHTMASKMWLAWIFLHGLLRVGNMQLLGALSHSFGTIMQQQCFCWTHISACSLLFLKTKWQCLHLSKKIRAQPTLAILRTSASAWQTVRSGGEKRRQDLLSARLRASWAPPISVNPHWDKSRLIKVLLPFKA